MKSGRRGSGWTGSTFDRWGQRSRDIVVSSAVGFAVYRVPAFESVTGNAEFGPSSDSMTTVSMQVLLIKYLVVSRWNH